MKLNEVFAPLKENDVKGKKVTKSYPILYHMTDYQGFSHTVSNDSLTSQRQPYISVTYDKDMLHVGGRDHYHFRFQMDGEKILSNHEGYYYTSYAHIVGNGSGKHWYDEKEIGVQTKSLTPFKEVCLKVDILIPVFSRSFIQWLFYKTSSIRGVEALAIVLNEWKKPITVGGKRPFTDEEKAFLQDCFKLRNTDFEEALEILVEKYDGVQDHFGKKLTSKRLKNEKYIPARVGELNDILAEKPFDKIDVSALKRSVGQTVKVLNPEKADEIMRDLEKHSLFNPYLAPINWRILFRDIADDDDYESYYDDMAKESKQREAFYKEDTAFSKYMKHNKAAA